MRFIHVAVSSIWYLFIVGYCASNARVWHMSLTDRPCLAVTQTGGSWASSGTMLVLGQLVAQLDRLELLFVVRTLPDDWS